MSLRSTEKVTAPSRLVKPPRVVHHMEGEPQLGQHTAHQLVGARASGERDEFAVEVDVGGRDALPVALALRALTARHGRFELVQRVRRLSEPVDDGTFDQLPGAVDVHDVLHGQHADEYPPVELVNE